MQYAYTHDGPFGASDGLMAEQLGTNARPNSRHHTHPIAMRVGAQPAASLLSSRRWTDQASCYQLSAIRIQETCRMAVGCGLW